MVKKCLCISGGSYIMHGGFHFTARIIHPDGSIWFHDGQKGHLGEKDGSLDTTSDKDLRSCRGRKLVLAVYAQECEM
jgi:hypothetical protein